MKKYLLIGVMVSVAMALYGCGKKQSALDDMQEPMTMDALSVSANPTTPVVPAPQDALPPSFQGQVDLAPLPPSGPYQPTVTEIQTALKNANMYMGEVDGKLGAKSKKAIEEFQKANNLKVDGKVGPKTWELLKTYLNPQPQAAPVKKKR